MNMKFFSLGPSSDEPNCERYSQGGFSYEEEGLVVEDKRGDGTCEAWDMMIGGYNWRAPSRLLSQTGEKTPVGTFEQFGDVVHRPQKNVKDNVKASWKNRLLERDQMLRCLLLNVKIINPTIQTYA